jgi:Holliday junction resolvase RusA-like endonuclease
MRVLFTVPGLTCSTNATYLRGRGRSFYKSEKAHEFQQRVALFAAQAMRRRRLIDEPCGYQVDVYFKNPRADLSGPVKLLEDALNGIVWKDDNLVRAMAWRKHLDAEIPRLMVEVYTLDPLHSLRD